MTKASEAKPTIRETAVYERSSALVVGVYPKYLSIRLKGNSEALNVPYGDILSLARRLNYGKK